MKIRQEEEKKQKKDISSAEGERNSSISEENRKWNEGT
jgi:hypothetical protein